MYKFVLAALLFLLCFIASDVLFYYQAKARQKAGLLLHLRSEYKYDKEVLIKRGPYSGCTGRVMAYNEFDFIFLFKNCKDVSRSHVVVQAHEFDDEALAYNKKFED